MSNPLRILTIGHSHVVGMNRAMWREIGANSDFDVTVAAPRSFKGDLRLLTIDSELPGSPLKVVALDAAWTGCIHGFRYDDAQLRQLMREGQFDIVHAWEEPYIYAGYQIARSLKNSPSRFVFLTAQNLFKRYPPPFNYFESQTLKRAQAWIADGNLVFETMLQRGYPKDSGRILTLAVDLTAFRPIRASEREQVLKELGIQPPVLGFLGRLSKDKGWDVLMRALELLPESQSWNLLAVGSGPYQSTIESWSKARRWRDRIHIRLVKHEDVPRFVVAMDMLLAPSQTTRRWREQLGRMIVEAFACGVPVIGSDSGEIPFVVGDAGLIASERDPSAWADAIQRLLNEPNLRADLAQRALQRAERYSCSVVAARFAEFYRWLADQPLLAGAEQWLRAAHAPSVKIAANQNGHQETKVLPHPRRLISIAHSYCVALNRRLAHEMAQIGTGKWEVTAVSPSFFSGDLMPVPLERADGESCQLEAVPAHLTGHIHVMFYGSRLRELLKMGWDLVHCWEEPYVLSGGQIALWTPASSPMVFWTFQNIPKRYPFPFSRIEEYCLERCAGWAAQGESIKQTMLERGYGKRPHSIIPLGVDTDDFYPQCQARQRVLHGLGWETDSNIPVVGFLGRLVPEKGLDLLTHALDRVRTPWRALFVGNGPMESHLRKWSRRYGDRVRLLTNVKHAEVASHLNAMDVLCAPSQTTSHWREQFGRMVIEAFACGIPVIASDSGELPHVVEDAGVIVPEKNCDGWMRAIEELIGNSTRRNELAARGLDRVHRLYTWKVVARKHLEFFDQITDSKR